MELIGLITRQILLMMMLIIVGIVVSLTIVGAIIGIPFVLFGFMLLVRSIF